MREILKRISVFSFLFLIVFSLLFSFFIKLPYSKAYSSEVCLKRVYASANNYEAPPKNQSIFDFFKNLFKKNDSIKTNLDYNDENVFLGGYPLGFSLQGRGVVVIGISEVITNSGKKFPTKISNIKQGDILTSIEGIDITSGEQIGEIINNYKYAGRTLEIKLNRRGEVVTTVVTPAIDALTNTYKLGLWIRDNAAGVGTLTYIKTDGSFGALGHPVCDIDTGSILPVLSGGIFKCNIVGVVKGKRAKPGELKGLFLKNGNKLGKVTSNTEYGVFGQIDKEHLDSFNSVSIKVGKTNAVVPGKAKIYCTIDGTMPKYYDIEIIKTNYKNSKDKKNMIIRTTDQELLDKTGGIIQGMSGSPIIQNGKLIGSVTHVFINDPTKGFAIYIDHMLNQN